MFQVDLVGGVLYLEVALKWFYTCFVECLHNDIIFYYIPYAMILMFQFYLLHLINILVLLFCYSLYVFVWLSMARYMQTLNKNECLVEMFNYYIATFVLCSVIVFVTMLCQDFNAQLEREHSSELFYTGVDV